MARMYIKNGSGKFVKPIYYSYAFWAFIMLSLTALFFIIDFVLVSLFDLEILMLSILKYIFCLLSFVYFVFLFFRFLSLISKYSGLKNYIYTRSLEDKIKINIIDTMSLNKMINTQYIEVPAVDVDLSTETAGYIIVKLERLAGMNDIDILIKNINNGFRGRYKDYAVKTFKENLDGLSYIFKLENVNSNKRLEPRSINDLVVDDKYSFVLQQGLIWKLNEQPHAIVTGKTGSGKSTFLLSLLMQILYKDLEFFIIDPKHEFSAFYFIDDKVLSSKDDILNILDDVLDVLKDRQIEVKNKVSKTGLIGGTAADFNIKPYIIIFDEMSAFVASLDNKEKKLFDSKITQIVQKGRSVGIFLIVAMQNANSETIKVAIRNQFAFRLLLGTASSEDIRFMFGSNSETIVNNLDKFTGYYYLEGVTEQPELFYISDLYKHKLNNLDYYKTIYEKR